MADEIRVTQSVSIQNGNLQYVNRPSSFTATMTGAEGPCPGALKIPVGGKIIDLSELGTPGLYVFTNVDPTNFVEYGIYDLAANKFYPWGEILPGECYVGRFSRNFREEYTDTGTGTTPPTTYLFMKADTAQVVVKVEAFEA